LRDAQTVIQKQKTGEGSKMSVRQLRNQLEDAEFSSAAAVKAKKTMELELADLQQQLDELFKAKQEVKCSSTLLYQSSIIWKLGGLFESQNPLKCICKISPHNKDMTAKVK